MDWFLYGRDLRCERVKKHYTKLKYPKTSYCIFISYENIKHKNNKDISIGHQVEEFTSLMNTLEQHPNLWVNYLANYEKVIPGERF